MATTAASSTEFIARTTAIPGLLLFDVSRIIDERGYFQEKFQKEKLTAVGLPESFNIVQNSLVCNKKGVTRGIHAEPWSKYVSVDNGEAFVAFVDLRKGDSFGTVVTTTLNPEVAAFVPAGVGNSYQCLIEDLFYLYSADQHWSAAAHDKYTFVNLGDPALGIDWPIPLDQAILSDKDRSHPLLKHVKPVELITSTT